MKLTIPENTLMELSEFISSNLALYFPKNRFDDLERNIISASKEFGYDDVEKFISRIISSPLKQEHAEILAANLTINETYFWREPQTFKALEEKILPELIRKKQNGDKRIRIWSAGCSSGEEPYSIAIAISRLIKDLKDWNISILATDISPKILRKAARGLYSQWSFRNTPEWLTKNYITKQDDKKFEISPKIKDMVKFDYLNLAEDVYPSSLNDTNAMDIIYCRNVLMYFTQDRFRKVVRGFYNSLVKDGYMIVSASELSVQNFPDFNPVSVPGMVLYQKTDKKVKSNFRVTMIEPEIQSDFWKVPEPQTKFDFVHKITPEKEIIPEEKIAPVKNTVYEESLKAYSLGEYEEVSDTIEKIEPTTDERILLIRAYANEGKLLKAIESCEEAIALDKIDPRLHYLYATILQENKQIDEAVVALKRAIYLDPSFVLAYYSLGKIYQRNGKIKEAKKCFQNVNSILSKCSQDEILFESEGLTAGRFKEIINATDKSRE